MKIPDLVTLSGRHVQLQPLAMLHALDLFASFAEDPGIWRYLPLNPPRTAVDMQAIVAAHLDRQLVGAVLPFAQVDTTSRRAVGITCYLDIRIKDRALEIGSTWLGRSSQRTGINTEAKYLLLSHAFEELGVVRVQLKTDSRNLASQAAIERLGAQREGVLRKHMRLWDGFIRDTVVYSILDTEWPDIKARLEIFLQHQPV